MKRMINLFVLAMTVCPVLASEAPVKKESITEPKFTRAECLTILSGLNALDGYQTVVNAGKPNEHAITKAYEFGNAKLRTTIRDNIVALSSVQEVNNKVQQDTVKELAGEDGIITPTIIGSNGKDSVINPKYTEYVKKVNESQQLPCPAILAHISISDLKLDKNEIPGSVLSALDKILDK